MVDFPQLSFSLSEIPNIIRQGQQRALREQVLQSAGNDASPATLADLGMKLVRAGDLEGGISLARIGEASARDARDFGFRQQEAARAQGNADRSFGLQQRQVDATLEGSKVPAGFRQAPDGTLQHIPGGPADPKYIHETTEAKDKGKQFNAGEITKLSEEGGKYTNLANFNSTFQDRFAGYKLPGVGNAAMTVGRFVPGAVSMMPGMNEADIRDGAQWWQGYDRYKNVVRNDLFGSALTATEQAAFERADIGPGMDPAQIRSNLTTQQNILKDAMKRKAGALIAGGYQAEPIARAYGLTLEELGVQPKKAPSAVAPKPGVFDRATVEAARSNPQGTLAEAKDAVAKGAPLNDVAAMLARIGINPALLTGEITTGFASPSQRQ